MIKLRLNRVMAIRRDLARIVRLQTRSKLFPVLNQNISWKECRGQTEGNSATGIRMQYFQQHISWLGWLKTILRFIAAMAITEMSVKSTDSVKKSGASQSHPSNHPLGDSEDWRRGRDSNPRYRFLSTQHFQCSSFNRSDTSPEIHPFMPYCQEHWASSGQVLPEPFNTP